MKNINNEELVLYLCEKLSEVEEARKNGLADIPADTVSVLMREAIKESENL